MAKAKAAMARQKREPKVETLGPGLHAAWIELRSAKAYRVRTMAGTRLSATAGDGVDQGLLEDCLREARMVVLADTQRGPTIVGALQTTRPAYRERDGAVVLRGTEVRLAAEQAVTIEAGPVVLRLEKSGAARFEGERMVIDMGSLVRVLAARVELP